MLSDAIIKGTKNTHKGTWVCKCNQCNRQIDIRDLNDDSMYGIKYRVCNECNSKGLSNRHNYIKITKQMSKGK